jgi:hypothetical protein
LIENASAVWSEGTGLLKNVARPEHAEPRATGAQERPILIGNASAVWSEATGKEEDH